MKAVMFTDGGARPTNPGHAGIGIVIQIGDREECLSRYIGKKSNNEAEYIALFTGVGYAYYLGARQIEIFSDSTLVVNQVNGTWRPKDFRMRCLCHDTQDRLNKLYGEGWKLKHCPRAQNAQADALCTDAIYWGMNKNPWTPKRLREKRPVGKVVDPFQMAHALVPQT